LSMNADRGRSFQRNLSQRDASFVSKTRSKSPSRHILNKKAESLLPSKFDDIKGVSGLIGKGRPKKNPCREDFISERHYRKWIAFKKIRDDLESGNV